MVPDNNAGRRALLLAGIGGLALPVAARQAQAASLQITPVYIGMGADQQATTLSILNRADVPANLQVRCFRWSQHGNEDLLTATPDLVVSPPQFALPPGETQTIRVFSRDRNRAAERYFRVLVDEIPDVRGNSVTMAMRVSLPVVQEPAQRGSPTVEWSIIRDASGIPLLVARNTGNRLVRFNKLEAVAPGGRAIEPRLLSQNAYALPEGERRWSLEPIRSSLRAGDALRVSFETMSAQPQTITVRVA